MTTVQRWGGPWLALPLAAALLTSTQAMAELQPIPPDAMIKPHPTACETAQVLRVIDGDTLVVAGSQGTEKVRISQIAAPETSQPYGREAASCLASLVADKSVSMCRDGRDRYGRTVADLVVGSTDVAAHLVEKGCAWAYPWYLGSNSPLRALQGQAQASDQGLWSQMASSTAAVPPWGYRGSSVPVPLLSDGLPAVNVSVTNTAPPTSRVLDWAELKFDELLRDGTATVAVGTGGGGYRCYRGGICVGVLDGSVVFYDGQQIRPLASEADALRAAQGDGF